MIQKRKVRKGQMMLSPGVESLFTSVRVQDAIELTIKLIMKKNKETKNYTKLNAKDLRNLFGLAVCDMLFRFYDEMYYQCDGVSMDSPLVPLLADVYMCHVEEKLEGYENYDKIKLFLRYVDDTFIVFSGNEQEVEKLVKFINSSTVLKFTSEMENNFELSFLDVTDMRNRSSYETTVYKKKTHTGQLLHWQSCQARRYKIG